MTELVEQVKVEASQTQKVEYVAYFILGVMEVVLGFQFILRLMGASTGSSFVRVIYSIADLLAMPFSGIFQQGVTDGLETAAVFEPATVVAMIVYAVIVWGIVKLLRISSGEQQPE